MKTNIHFAKTHFSKLVARAETGEEIIIARGGKAVAKLVGLKRTKSIRKPGTAIQDAIYIADDFDAPLPEDVLRDFHA